MSRRLIPVILPCGVVFLGAPLLADSYSSAVLSDSPLAYYRLGDTAPPDIAINSGSLGATLDGSHVNVAHRYQGALFESLSTSNHFSGTSRSVVPYHPALNPPASQSFTIEAWLKPTIEGQGNAQAPLFNRHSNGNRQGWVFFQRASAGGTDLGSGFGWNFRMYNENGGNTSINITSASTSGPVPGSYTVGTWSHVALVWDGATSTATLYVDGLQAAQQTGGYVANSDIPFGVGSYSANNAGDNPYTGEVDEVAFYPTALTQTQLNDHLDVAYAIDTSQSYAEVVAGDGATLHLRMDEHDSWRVPATNLGSLGAEGDGVHFPGVKHQIPGALASDPDPAMGHAAIDQASSDGGVPTVIPFKPELNTAVFSAEAWLKPDIAGVANAQSPIANRKSASPRTGWIIYQRSPTDGWNLRMYNGADTATSVNLTAGPYTVGQWQHFVVTFDGTTARMYLNGTLAGSQGLAGTYEPNSDPTIGLGLGGVINGTENPFTGGIDEFALYDTVLTPAQITAHHQAGVTASPATPYEDLVLADGAVEYLRLNEAAKPTATNLGTLGAAANAIPVNAPAAITGPVAPAFTGFDTGKTASDFDSTRTYADLLNPAGLNLTGAITLEAWIQPDPSQPNPSANIISHGGNDDFSGEVYLRIEGGNYEVGANGGKATFPIPDEDLTGDAWVHLAGTWSGGQWRLYRNGSEVATGADANGAVAVANANWSIGARGRWKYGTGFPLTPDGGATRIFAGGIADAAIYNSALSANRVESHFMAGIGSSPLIITRPGGVITLEWAGGILQQSDTLSGWADVIGAVSPYQPSDGDRHFYRLRY
jgi:hypothetical protein